MEPAATSGDFPTESSAAITPAPTAPPTLKKPWNPDIIDRPLAASTTIAWMFIATSMAPRPAPNTISVTASKGSADDVASSGRLLASITAATTMTARQPNLDASTPENGMVIVDPIPRHSRSSPRLPSLMAACAFAYGTSAAHAALPNPATKNATRDARCSPRPGRAAWSA